MNYYQPRQKAVNGKPTGVWHFTCMNNGRIWPIGYCADRDCNCQHATPLEASNCYARYIKEKCKGKLPGGFDLEHNPEEEIVIQSSY